MAVISLSKTELQSISQIGAILNRMAKMTGGEEINEIRYYDEYFTAKTAQSRAAKKASYSPKSEIEKLL
jgi:hypothetical protein